MRYHNNKYDITFRGELNIKYRPALKRLQKGFASLLVGNPLETALGQVYILSLTLV